VTEQAQGEILVTTWATPEWFEVAPAVRVAGFGLGDRTGSGRTTLLVTNFPPGAVIPAHSHDTDMVDVIVEGSLERDGVVWGTGTLRFVPRGAVYGTATVGPDGVTMLELYGERRGVIGDPADPDGSPMADDAAVARFDEMLGPR
jgi:ChrR Cupin-like domain